MSEKEEKNIEQKQEKKNRTHRGNKNWAQKQIHQHNLFYLVGVGIILFLITTATAALIPATSVFNVPPSYRAHEYTPLQAEGRDLYMELGCFYCHSQQSREADWTGYNGSLMGDYAFDIPNSLGTERSGPDLAQIGGHRPTFWIHTHDIDPRQLTPNSIMPNFAFLTNHQLEAMTEYIQNLAGYDLNTYNFIIQTPEEFQNISNPFMPLMMKISSNYQDGAYSGPADIGEQWATTFDHGKELYAQHCITCHGCSGNGQGPYARTAVTTPANLHERISRYPGDYFHYFRVSQGVPGTYMPNWGESLSEEDIFYIMIYEMSFADQTGHQVLRTVPAEVSDHEGDAFNSRTNPTPIIKGTYDDYVQGKGLYTLYCLQCHGDTGQGDGPASNMSRYGYILPVPANFTQSGQGFPAGDYGRWVWKVTEGVETTNMPPWKWNFNPTEIAQVIFYEQSFSTPTDYDLKWAPYYNDSFGKNMMTYLPSSYGSSITALNPAISNVLLATILVTVTTTTFVAKQIITKTPLKMLPFPKAFSGRLNIVSGR